MKLNLSRRGFLGVSAGFALAGHAAKGPRRVGQLGHKIRLAVVGVMGKGYSDWMPMVKSGLAEVVGEKIIDTVGDQDAAGDHEAGERHQATPYVRG